MATPTITPMPSQPENTDQRDVFVKKAFALWNWLKANVANFNAIASFSKSEADRAKQEADRAEDSEEVAINAKNQAQTARDTAIDAKNQIQGYVIPEGATYSKELLDNRFATLGNAIWKNTADIAKIKIEGVN